MARPLKQTVDYFAHDSDATEGRTLSILFNNFGHEGISCWWQLLERISRTNNHVISLRNGEDIEYLSAKLHFQPARLKEILAKLAELGAIDHELFDGGLIWSQNFVERLEQVYKTRKQEIPPKPVLSVKETKLSTKETKLLTPETPHTILKDTTLNNTKQDNTKQEKGKYGEFNNVLLTEDERLKLVERFGEVETKDRIERLSSGIASKGYKYVSHYATILNWKRRDEKEKRNATNQRSPRQLPDRSEYNQAPKYDDI